MSQLDWARVSQSAWVKWTAWTVLFCVFTAIMPRDADFDVAHYHIHNGWSALNGRLGYDFAPAEMHSFLNPFYNVIVYWLIEHLPGPFVAALIAIPQALILPVLYYLTKHLGRAAGVALSPVICLLAASCGFLAEGQIALFSSIRNDDWTACAFLAALLLLISHEDDAPPLHRFALGAFLVGLVTGMKLTSVPYAIGFAAAAMIAAPDMRARVKVGAACFAAGLAGILITGGWWFWTLWDMFGNPVFPMGNGVFHSSDGLDESFSDTRHLPGNFLEGVIRPFLFLFDGRLINERQFVDPRFLMTYLPAIAVIMIGLISPRMKLEAPPRALLAICVGLVAGIAVWTAMFSIMRYMMAAWIIGPTLLVAIIAWLTPKYVTNDRATLMSLAVVVATLMISSGPGMRRVPWNSWNEAYVAVDRPSGFEYENSFILMTGKYPVAFTSIAFPEARLSHADVQDWSRRSLDNYRWRRDEALARHDGPIYAVMMVYLDPEAAAEEGNTYVTTPTLGLEGLKLKTGLVGDADLCRPLRTSFDLGGESWVLCPVKFES